MSITLLKIIEIKHVSADGKILWEAYNLPNTFHQTGETFLLSAVFTGGQTNIIIPANYYFGLDTRSNISVSDTMNTLQSLEPSGSGYFRQAVSSSKQFTMSVNDGGHSMAMSPILTFTATGGGWGPVSNLFLTDKFDNTGYLIASVPLNTAVSVAAGEGIHMRMSLALGNDSALAPVPA